MYQTLLALVAVAIASSVAAESTCYDELSSADFQQLFCNSSLVFRGSGMAGSSGLAWDRDVRVVFQTFIFSADQVYRGALDNAQSISILREWRDNSGCSQGAIPDNDSGVLVFATGSGNSFDVGSCRRIFSWDCIPQSVKDSLPLNCPNA